MIRLLLFIVNFIYNIKFKYNLDYSLSSLSKSLGSKQLMSIDYNVVVIDGRIIQKKLRVTYRNNSVSLPPSNWPINNSKPVLRLRLHIVNPALSTNDEFTDFLIN